MSRIATGDYDLLVMGVESEIREALTNLIFNAVDAIPKRGTITVGTEVQGRWLVITVADDGIGMSEEVKARCLELIGGAQSAYRAAVGLHLIERGRVRVAR